MNEKELEILWKFMKKEDQNLMDFSTFKSKMNTPEKRKSFYDANYQDLVERNFLSDNLTPDGFEKKYGTPSTPQPKKSKFTEVNIKPEEVCNGTKVVSKGMKGDIVKIIQNELNVFNSNKAIPPTGNFGDQTKTAVVKFQTEANPNLIGSLQMRTDGSVDRKTWRVLFVTTKYDCDKIDTKPTEVNPAETKPSEVKPAEVKPTDVKPTDVKPTETTPKGKKIKGIWTIKEQVTVDKGKLLDDANTIKGKNGLTCIENIVRKLNLGPHPTRKSIKYKLEDDNPAFVFKGVDPETGNVDDVYIIHDGMRLYGQFFTSGSEFGIECESREKDAEAMSIINTLHWTDEVPNIGTDAYSTRVDIRKQFPKYASRFPNGLDIYYTGTTRSSVQRGIVNDLMNDIGKKDDVDGKVCRKSVDVLYDAKKGYEKGIVYFSGDTELETVRAYVKRCQIKYETNLLNKIFSGGTDKKYEELKSRKYYDTGVSKFNLGEQKKPLESLIKTKLMEMKKLKDRGLNL